MTRISLIIILSFITTISVAQQKYWIYFEDKTGTKTTESCYDKPIKKENIELLSQLNITPICTSNWLNAVSCLLTEHQINSLRTFTCVASISKVNTSIKTLSTSSGFDDTLLALNQIHADTLKQLSLTGKGIKVGIIDGGFLGADHENSLQKIINDSSWVAYKNYINPDVDNPFIGNARFNDDHGTKVWKKIAGQNIDKNIYYGAAVDASFYLARTDQGDKEYHGEEDYWIEALEWMYTNGVQIVNSSLGYSIGFDKKEDNYTPDDVTGKSAISTAATIATKEKGMIIVIAAGNDGNNQFGVVSLPGDAEGAITVGATGYNKWRRQYYSSVGTSTLPYIKPDIACYSATGTSFSAPVITGVLAAIKSGYPKMENKKIIEALYKSCHLYQYKNTFLGYGVPDVRKTIQILENKTPPSQKQQIIKSKEDKIEVTISESKNVVIYYKDTKSHVVYEKTPPVKNNNVSIKRAKGINYTTIATPNELIEVVWK